MKEIKEQIEKLYKQLEEVQNPASFTLNKSVVEINKQISSLQEKCKHNFINGVCEYCYKEEQR